MKVKHKIAYGIALLGTVYCVFAYAFMWPPVVLNYFNWHTYDWREGEWVFSIPSIPSPWKARAVSCADPCINNLRQIDAAANQFALQHHLTNGASINFPDDLTPYIKLNSAGKIPPCPAGGIYSISVFGTPPICSISTIPVAKVRTNSFFYYVTGPGNSHRLP